MAESDLEKNAEFSQAYGHNHDGEDPRVAAQRLLNIFRQLHIFSAHKRKEFNDNLLKQPFPVKKALAALPGGGLVLEYLNDLQEEAGLQSDSILLASSKENIKKEIQSAENHDEIAQVKILAKALSEAKVSPSQLSDDDVKRISKDLQDKFNSLKNELESKIRVLQSSAADGKITPIISQSDENLLKTISEAFQNIANQQEELTKIKQDFMSKFSDWVESNQELVQSLADKNNHLNSENNDIRNQDFLLKFSDWAESNQELVQSLANRTNYISSDNQNPASSFSAAIDFESIIKQITDKQAEMFKEFSKQQADNLGNILSNVLKENNSASLKVIEQALQTFQSENARFLEIQNNLKNSMPESHTDVSSSLKNDSSHENSLDTEGSAVELFSDNENKKRKNKKKNKKKENRIEDSLLPENPDFHTVESNAISNEDALVDYSYQPAEADTDYEWEYVDSDAEIGDDADYVWEYVDESDEELSSNDDADYVWEYVEEEYDDSDDNNNDTSSLQVSNESDVDSSSKHFDTLEKSNIEDSLPYENIFSSIKLSGLMDVHGSGVSPYPKPAL